MITRIARTIASLIAVLTFVVIGAQIVGDFRSWECTCTHSVCEWCVDDWTAFHADAVEEYSAQFDALFNSYETKWAKNGRLMLRKPDTMPFAFKFVAMS